ncbi:MAG: hypothetical protein AAF637_18565, partial [Pseudomonadota bacterium]
ARKEQQQAIREAVVLYTAVHGLEAARKYKAGLLADPEAAASLVQAGQVLGNSKVPITAEEALEIVELAGDELASLLNVPDSLVADPANRDAIREAVLLDVISNGAESAAKFRTNLIDRAGEGAKWLQTEINTVKMPFLARHLDQLAEKAKLPSGLVVDVPQADGTQEQGDVSGRPGSARNAPTMKDKNNTKKKRRALSDPTDHRSTQTVKQKQSAVEQEPTEQENVKSQKEALECEARSKAMREFIQAHPDVLCQPSEQMEENLGHYAGNFGLERALVIVDRLERNGVVTEQDRQDLNAAMNPLGRDKLYADASVKDVLGPYVNQPFTPQAKHAIAHALYKQFGQDYMSRGGDDFQEEYGYRIDDFDIVNYDELNEVFSQVDAETQLDKSNFDVADQEIKALKDAAWDSLLGRNDTTSMFGTIKTGLLKGIKDHDPIERLEFQNLTTKLQTQRKQSTDSSSSSTKLSSTNNDDTGTEDEFDVSAHNEAGMEYLDYDINDDGADHADHTPSNEEQQRKSTE